VTPYSESRGRVIDSSRLRCHALVRRMLLAARLRRLARWVYLVEGP
jgi:hypothetical protein